MTRDMPASPMWRGTWASPEAASRSHSRGCASGLVVEDDHKHLSLSEEGIQIARGIRTKRILIQALFREVLGVPDEVAEQDACKVEHLISDQTAEATGGFLVGLEKISSDSQWTHLLESLQRLAAATPTPFPGNATQELALRLEKKDSQGEDQPS